MSLGIFRRESVDGDGAARALRVLGVDGEHVRASGLKAADVEVGVRALNLGHDVEGVTVLGF